MRNWEESGLNPELLKLVQIVGYMKPSPTQMAAIPLELQHRDAIGVAETGSGKIASYVLPMVNYIFKQSGITGYNVDGVLMYWLWLNKGAGTTD